VIITTNGNLQEKTTAIRSVLVVLTFAVKVNAGAAVTRTRPGALRSLVRRTCRNLADVGSREIGLEALATPTGAE